MSQVRRPSLAAYEITRQYTALNSHSKVLTFEHAAIDMVVHRTDSVQIVNSRPQVFFIDNTGSIEHTGRKRGAANSGHALSIPLKAADTLGEWRLLFLSSYKLKRQCPGSTARTESDQTMSP
jgi:hypothetical protein